MFSSKWWTGFDTTGKKKLLTRLAGQNQKLNGDVCTTLALHHRLTFRIYNLDTSDPTATSSTGVQWDCNRATWKFLVSYRFFGKQVYMASFIHRSSVMPLACTVIASLASRHACPCLFTNRRAWLDWRIGHNQPRRCRACSHSWLPPSQSAWPFAAMCTLHPFDSTIIVSVVSLQMSMCDKCRRLVGPWETVFYFN